MDSFLVVIVLRIKKFHEDSNSSDGGNTGDGVKIAGGVIGSGDEIGAEVETFSELGLELMIKNGGNGSFRVDHKEQRKVAHLGYRKKKWGMRMNEGFGLFSGKGTLRA
ncbi:hypothetical protein Tco_0294872 [Tanacetum coccineum]